MGDSEGEEEAPIKWRDYEMEIFIAIRSEMEEKFAKSARKQSMYLRIYILIDIYLIEQKYKSSDTDWANWAFAPGPPFPPLKDLGISSTSEIESGTSKV